MPTYRYDNHDYSLYGLRRKFPNISFPASPTAADLAPFGVIIVPDPEPVPPTLDEAKAAKLAEIDAETSAEVLAGFVYEIDGVRYRFSYDAFDQQNFSDTANVCILKLNGTAGLPDSVVWNSYSIPDGELVRQTFDAAGFLRLYTAGAMAHKNRVMQEGGARKSAVEAATIIEEVEAA